MPLRTLRCAIEDLDGWYPRLLFEPHSVACVAVMSRYSAPPATFDVACEGITSLWLAQDSTFRLEVSWAEETAAKGTDCSPRCSRSRWWNWLRSRSRSSSRGALSGW